MKRVILIVLGVGVVVSSAGGLGFGTATREPTVQMTQGDLDAALGRIASDSDAVMARCAQQPAATRELCRAQAQADEMVRAADAELQFRRTGETARAVQRARIEARYLVDRARCAALTGWNKDSCLVAIHAVRGRALLESATPYRQLASN